MYLLNRVAIPSEALDAAIYALLKGRGLTGVTARQERIRRGAFYDRYATECLRAAFPQGIPSNGAETAIWGVRPTVELVEQAAEACYEFRRRELGPRLTEVKLECRLLLQGFLGVDQHVRLESYDWDRGLPSKNRSIESIEDEERRFEEGWRAGMAEIQRLIDQQEIDSREAEIERTRRSEQSRELHERMARYSGYSGKKRRRLFSKL